MERRQRLPGARAIAPCSSQAAEELTPGYRSRGGVGPRSVTQFDVRLADRHGEVGIAVVGIAEVGTVAVGTAAVGEVESRRMEAALSPSQS